MGEAGPSRPRKRIRSAAFVSAEDLAEDDDPRTRGILDWSVKQAAVLAFAQLSTSGRRYLPHPMPLSRKASQSPGICTDWITCRSHQNPSTACPSRLYNGWALPRQDGQRLFIGSIIRGAATIIRLRVLRPNHATEDNPLVSARRRPSDSESAVLTPWRSLQGMTR